MYCDGSSLQDQVLFESRARRVDVKLHSHGWSGFASVECNGVLVAHVDLYRRENSAPYIVPVENPQGDHLRITVRPGGEFNAAAQARQVIIEGFIEHGNELVTPVYAKPDERNRGGDFRPRFFEIAHALGPDEVILDIGGGKRQLADSRYLNLEYASFDEPDLFGDALALPFKDHSIDFVYTAAVLEHLRDPLRAGREIYRVLRPGGRLLANSAFMQPVHSEGQHFFNATPYGIEEIFSAFSDRVVSWEGSLTETVQWMLDLSAVSASVAPGRMDEMRQLLQEFDRHLSRDRLMYFASGVWLEARKPWVAASAFIPPHSAGNGDGVAKRQ
jgi:SAM-dependent methyltransferase